MFHQIVGFFAAAIIGFLALACVVLVSINVYEGGYTSPSSECAARGGQYIYNDNGPDVCIKKSAIVDDDGVMMRTLIQ